jgi:hypothetical protein
MFGLGRPRALDHNAKVRIRHWARCLPAPTNKASSRRSSKPAARARTAHGLRMLTVKVSINAMLPGDVNRCFSDTPPGACVHINAEDCKFGC